MSDLTRRIAQLSAAQRALLAERLEQRRLAGRARLSLTAYVVAEDGPPPREGELRQFVRERLPDYMVPEHIVWLDALPLTASGKLDRRQLAAAVPRGRGALGSQPLPVLSPLSPVEEVVASVWRELLGGPLPGRDSHFFELGGHSLLATRVVSRLGRVLGVELPLRALFEAPTVAGLAARAEALLQRHGGRAMPPLAPRGAAEAPVSFGQERLWLLDRLEPASAPAYNLTGALRLTGELDVAALHQALADIVARHEVLRTAFVDVDGAPRPEVAAHVELPLPCADLRALAEERRGAELAALAEQLALRPFSLAEAPLLRVLLVRLAEEVHVLVYSMHHIASDGWSLGLLVRELSQRYAERVQGLVDTAPPLPLQFGDFAAWQRGWLSGDVLEAELAYWRERLGGAPAALGLPTDRPRPATRSYRGAAHPLELPAPLVEGLRALARREGSTLFMAVLAAFSALLSRLSGQSDVVIGSPIANRAAPETEELLGFFVNSLALRCEVQGDQSFAALLRQARQVCLDAYAHQDVPFEKVVEAVNPARDPSRHPLFQVTLTLQNTPAPAAEWPGLRVALEDLPAKVAPFELSLFLHERDGGLAGFVVYNSDLFDAATIAQWARHLERLMRGALAQPEAKLGELPLLDEAERRELIALGSATSSHVRPNETLLSRFAAQVARTPDAVAVSCEGDALSYRALDRRANQLAHALIARGVGREVLVGLFLDRSLELVVAILAVLKAGGAYLPLDPAYPPARRAFMMEDAAVGVLVTTRASGGAAGFAGRVCELDVDAAELAAQPEEAPPVQSAPSDLAYVIYTSGSTGTPKGVQVEHGNVLRLFDATDAWFGFSASDVWTLFHSAAFDFSVWELWGALLYGGRLVVVPYLVSRSPDSFFALLLREGVTVLNQTPSAFRSLLHCQAAVAHRAEDAAMRLRWVVFGGEALELGSLAPWFERYGDDAPALVNMYGITETTVHVTFRRITRGDVEARRGSLIGRPIPDLSLHLLDSAGGLVPLGVAGEICVGGAGVARGYLGRPELTAARFVSSSLMPGERLYRSGDLARRTRDGELEYLGRLDHQVKIRGFRIELGEIEATLLAHPAVREVTVQLRTDGGDQRLVAYWVPEAAAGEASAAELREHLKEKLPPYMVPSSFVALPALPLTPEGKIHRAALPAPELTDRVAATAYEAPRSESERLVAGIWQDLLSVHQVGRHDNFFELGGHSLLAIRTASRLRTARGVELPLRFIFEGQTVAEVAAGLDKLLAESGPAAPPEASQITLYGLPITRLPPQEHYELSAYQLPEWYMYQLAPNNPFYNVSNSDEILTGDLDLDAYVRAWQTLIDRQASLRTYFDYVDGKPVQKIVPEVKLRLEDIYIDCTGVAEEDVDREMRQLIDVNSCTIFDFSKAPLLVLKLAEFPGKRFLLIFATHHIIWDEICTMTVARELSILYNAYHAGREPDLPPLPCEYVDFAHWINRAVAEGYLDEQRRYWLDKFRELPPALELPTDHPRPAFQTFNGATVSEVLSPATYKKVMGFLKENNTTLYIFMLAVLNLHIYRLTGQPDFVVGTPIANRDDERLDSIVGVFATAMPMRCQIAEAMTFERLLAETRQVAVEAYENHTYPSIIAIQQINPSADLSRARLFSVMYGVQNDKTELMRNLTFDGLELTFLRGAPTPEFDRAKFDFSLVVDTFEEDINVQWTHNTDLFETSTVARMLRQLLSLVEQVIDEPGRLITDYALLTAEEERAMLVGLNPTAQPLRQDACVHHLFEEEAARRPEALALVGEEEPWTYRQLDQAANRLAQELVAGGLQLEERVALVLPPSFAQVVAMLGVLKAGGAYVPIEVETPAARRDHIAEAAGCRWILDEPALQALRQRAAERPATPPERPVSARGLAYVLFTSGTTGVPKGIEIEHRGLVNLVAGTQRAYGLGAGDTALFITPYSFDASILDVFWPLASGARVAVPRPGDAKNPARIAELVAHHGVTMMQTVPLMLEALVAGRDSAAHGELATLRLLICGGSYLTRELCERARRAFSCQLANHYGPTEVTVDATRFVCDWPLEHDLVPIGRPVDNARVYVLDGNLRPVPFNVVGEIYVGSPGLARGYLGDAALTARRFLADPFSADPEARLYRTGDLGRFTSDGNLHFIGRVDKQVKIRGNRVELEEIETCLAAHADVRRCAVVNRKTAAGADCLVAYVERTAARGRLTGAAASPSLFTLAQRPELRQQMDLLHVGAWPEYFLYDAELKTHWSQLASEFAAYQLVLTDDRDEVLAVGNAVPIRWDGTLEDLPRGWDDGLARAFAGAASGEAPDTLLILAGVVAEAHKGGGLATSILEAFKCLGQAHHLARVIVPVRPTEKVAHPELTFTQWCEATRDDGLLRDGWLRSHQRVGGKVLRVELASQYVKAPLADWERWAGRRFASSGEYEVAGALQPVRISLEDGAGEYRDPSVWMQHFYDRPTTWTLDDAAALREHLRSSVPDYMIPEHVRYVSVLPLAPSGKVDERALPEVALDGAQARPFVAPSTPVQVALAAIWRELLGVAEVGVLDDFYELGGHSIVAVQMLMKINAAFSSALRLQDLFRERTIKGLERRLAEEPAAEEPAR